MRIATRGSALARVQANAVAAALDGEHEIVVVLTAGDRGEAQQDKARWVVEIEATLRRGAADCAVHSAKDVPLEMPDDLVLAAVPARAEGRDALVGAASLDALRQGARVGTSSLRRRAQLLAVRPDLDVVELRGNVDTRLRKLAAGEADALVLAAAGLLRLDRGAEIGALLEAVPAPGQGALLVQTRAGEQDRVAALDDVAARASLQAERACARALGGSCDTPLGASATGGALHAWVGLPDGSEWMSAHGDDAATQLLAAGAAGLLARAEAMATA